MVPEHEESKIVTLASLDFKFYNNDQNFDPDLVTTEKFHLFKDVFSSANVRDDRYNDRIFHGVLVDTGAAGRSTVGVGQAKHFKTFRIN